MTTGSKAGKLHRGGVASSKSREALFAAAQALIAEEGVAALTAGRLADSVGLSRQSFHYHFGTIDELLIALIEDGVEKARAATAIALAQSDPIGSVWSLFASTNFVTFQFQAISLRNEEIAIVWRRSLLELRSMISEGVAEYYGQQNGASPLDPAGVSLILLLMSQGLAFEKELGVSEGHREAEAAVKALLQTF